MSLGSLLGCRKEASMSNETISIDEAISIDVPFILDSWVKSSKETTPISRSDALNKMRSSTTIVAKAEGIIIGWLCFNEASRTIHYAYVKSTLRRMGILGMLLDKLSINRSDETISYSQDPTPNEQQIALTFRADGRMTLDEFRSSWDWKNRKLTSETKWRIKQ